MKCAFKMKLKPGCEVEYERRHRAIWPELVKLLRETGVSDYYIFWDKETNLLFGIIPEITTLINRKGAIPHVARSLLYRVYREISASAKSSLLPKWHGHRPVRRVAL